MKVGDLVRIDWSWLQRDRIGVLVEIREDWAYSCFVKHPNGETIYYMKKDLTVISSPIDKDGNRSGSFKCSTGRLHLQNNKQNY